MKSVNTLRRTSGIAAAVASLALAAPVFGITNVPIDQPGTPDDGMICRSGYTGALSGNAFKCSKTRTIQLDKRCTDPKFPKYVVRASGVDDAATGPDICTRKEIEISSTQNIRNSNLELNREYVYAAADPAEVAAAVAQADAKEAADMGLGVNEVDTVGAIAPTFQAQGHKDKVVVTITHYTFAVPTGNLVSARR